MLRTRQVVAAAVAALAAVAVAAIATVVHGGGADARGLPRCARPTASIARPGDLPRRFPYPTGTVFTRRYRNVTTRGVPQVDGRMPLGLAAARRFLDHELPRAGFKLIVRQEREREFSALYEVKGFGGQVTLTPLPGCRGATSFSVSARPTLLGRSHSE